MADSAEEDRWRRTARLSLTTVVGAAIGGVLLASISVAAASESGFPLAHVLVTALLPIGLAAVVFWSCDRQEAIDREYGHYGDR
jgi:hypothetical protein